MHQMGYRVGSVTTRLRRARGIGREDVDSAFGPASPLPPCFGGFGLIAAIEAGQVNVVIVRDIDRLDLRHLYPGSGLPGADVG